ncbi:MAG: hypothetical protein LQ352_001138 [Teloschistes flavicans]|nr:MAG: hypothetical protein LQ352_001138 [Teloschistes flavicans]
MRVVGHGKIAMAEVATAIASPCIQSSLCLQSTVEPLPASTVRLKKGLRRYTKGPSSKETPKGRILTSGSYGHHGEASITVELVNARNSLASR